MATDKYEPLKYTDLDDKCYGVAGMTIGLAVVDCEKYISDVSIDRENIESILFTPDFYVSENPRFSAKAVWNFMTERYQVATAMVLSNVMCRTMVKRHQRLTSEMIAAVRGILVDHADELCSLDKDEANSVVDKYTNYLMRIFSSHQVSGIVDSIVKQLQANHSISRSDIIDLLARIQ